MFNRFWFRGPTISFVGSNARNWHVSSLGNANEAIQSIENMTDQMSCRNLDEIRAQKVEVEQIVHIRKADSLLVVAALCNVMRAFAHNNSSHLRHHGFAFPDLLTAGPNHCRPFGPASICVVAVTKT
jgi:hypothetical protein